MSHPKGQGTIYIHGGDALVSTEHSTGSVVEPISLATTFRQQQPGVATAKQDPNSFGLGFEYSRTGNPTRGVFERSLAAAEGAKYCIAFSSGSAATSAVIHLLDHDDAILCIDDVYGGTQRYFRKIVSPSMNISVDFVDFNMEEEVKMKLTSRTKLLWLETPTNPTLKLTDIKRVSELAKANRSILAVDNTFCSPHFQSPLKLGADLVVHSVTKYINGHSDVVMGAVCTNDEEIYQKLRFLQNGIGSVPSPFDCYLAHRGLKTLHIRMEAAAKNALAIALWLEQHSAVKKVIYPGLPSHPQHHLAAKQQHGFGAMISFYILGSRVEAEIFFKNLHVFALAESLGAVESLAESPSLMTHGSVPDSQKKILGIDDTLIRLSVGIETCQDLIEDLDHALIEAVRNIGANKE